MGLFGKLFGRRELVVPVSEPVLVRAEPEPDFEEDGDWDWKVAYARNRPKTEPVARPVQPVVRQAAIHAAVRPMQPGTVIPVPMLPVATDPSQVRLRNDTRPVALPVPRHVRFARGTDRHDTQRVTTVKPVAAPPPVPRQTASASRPPPLPSQLRSGRR